tara:strand:- start:177 stop:629 length:453 start_codon:yes stop_codon:yes gene_type:complete
MPGPAVIPIVMGGIAAARLVAPKIAESLISRGLAKKATGDAAKLAKRKVQSGAVQEIKQFKDLPATIQNKAKSNPTGQQKPSTGSRQGKHTYEFSKNTAAENRARIQKLQEQEAKQAAAKAASKQQAKTMKRKGGGKVMSGSDLVSSLYD